jgi:hypothetical protein
MISGHLRSHSFPGIRSTIDPLPSSSSHRASSVTEGLCRVAGRQFELEVAHPAEDFVTLGHIRVGEGATFRENFSTLKLASTEP